MIKNRHLEKYFMGLILFFLASGCFSYENLQNNKVYELRTQKYPSAKYITGIGHGAELQTAKDNARAEIAKVFLSKIKQLTTENEKHCQKGVGKEQDITYSLNHSQTTSVLTKKVLSGIRVADIYVDMKKNPPEYIALAILNKYQAKNIIIEKIIEKDLEIKRQISVLNQTTDTVEIIRCIKKSLHELDMRKQYNNELQVLDQSGKGIPTSVSRVMLESRLYEILNSRFNIAVNISGNCREDVHKALIEALAGMGLTVSTVSDNADIIITGTAEILNLDLNDPVWFFVRWSADFQLINCCDNSIIGRFKISGKEGHLSRDEAENKAVYAMEKRITAETGKYISKYVFRLN